MNLNSHVVSLIASWLLPRSSHVVVSGSRSSGRLLRDMVYQGTVLGPSLWNAFINDLDVCIRFLGFECVPFLDRLSAFSSFKVLL